MKELSQKELEEIGRKIDDAFKYGEEAGNIWLRQAFWSNQTAIWRLRQDFDELRKLFLNNVYGPLTVKEAQMLRVCRICRKQATRTFILNYGKEFAHRDCLENKVITNQPFPTLTEMV